MPQLPHMTASEATAELALQVRQRIPSPGVFFTVFTDGANFIWRDEYTSEGFPVRALYRGGVRIATREAVDAMTDQELYTACMS